MYNKFWGYHLMLDCSGCKVEGGIGSRDAIYNFIKELVDAIDMEAHGEPIIEYLLPGDPKQGYSLLQLITTSNICGHFMDQPDQNGTAYFDVFSCKVYNQQTVIDVVNKYFEPKKMRVNFITRDAD
jgi:S-adenosylmethionine/arginine decarboxylase-like enzyme